MPVWMRLSSASPVRQIDGLVRWRAQMFNAGVVAFLDLLHEFARNSPQFDHDSTLCSFRFFQISKLTLEQCWIHEMSAPVSELICDEFIISPQKDELHVSIHSEISAICFLQRGTSEDRVLSCGNAAIDELAQTLQPRPSLLIRQRTALAHLLYVDSWVKIVGLIEPPAELLREQLADSGLTGARYTKNDYDHRHEAASDFLVLPRPAKPYSDEADSVV